MDSYSPDGQSPRHLPWLQIVFGVAIAMAIVILALAVRAQNKNMQRMYQLMSQIQSEAQEETDEPTEEEDETTTTQTDEPVLLGEETHELTTGTWSIKHWCEGDVVESRSSTANTHPELAAYCVGKNILTIAPTGMAAFTLVEQTSTGVEDAPALQGTSLVPSVGEAHEILISFTPDACLFDDDYCGVGITYGEMTHVAETVGTPSARSLTNFPADGALVWDGSGHAASVDSMRGGAGYGLAPVTVYDLATDTIRNGTTRTAVAPQDWADATWYAAGEYPTDATGASLAYWSDLTFNEYANHFQVTRNIPDGTTETITFE